MKKIIGAGSIFFTVIVFSAMTNVNAQLPPELIQSEQACEQLEISNRLYNPVTITLGYDKATLRTPEVIVSKSNPDAVVPIQILETNSNIFTNATGRFVAKLDLQYAAPSDMPRLVTYNIISGKGGMELERGTWFVDGKGFCKIITFTVTEEPHIPTTEEQLALAKEVTAVELKKNREEQMKTNDLITLMILAIVGLICALIVGKVINILVNHRATLTLKNLVDKLQEGRRLFRDSIEISKRSVEYNDTLAENQRNKLTEEITRFEKSLFDIVGQLKKHMDNSIMNLAFAFDSALKNNKPFVYEQKPFEIKLDTTLDQNYPEQKPKLNDNEFPKFVKDGLNLLDKGLEIIPNNPITDRLKGLSKAKEPETFEEWFEFYNKISSRDELLKIYTQQRELFVDKKDPNAEIRYKASYKVLKLRE